MAPWVAAIARNKIVDALRRRGLRPVIPIENVMDTLESEVTEHEGQAFDLESRSR